MRQTGVITAAGLYALQHNIERLAEDHANARLLAEGLQALSQQGRFAGQLRVLPVQTNILFTELPLALADALQHFLAQHQVQLTASNYANASSQFKRMRWVCHLDISRGDIEQTLDLLARFAHSEA